MMMMVTERFACDCTADSKVGFLHGVHDAGCASYGAIYDEICIDRGSRSLPVFPEQCPACGAREIARSGGGSPIISIDYGCGGSYRPKPQIQSHTAKWWGRCGLAKE
jgi:hypothetical protein